MLKICIIVDHPTRDLPGNIILANKLIEEKNRVFLIPSKYIEECLLIKPDLVIANYARPVYENFFKALNSKGIDLCVIDTEGAPFGKNNSHYQYYPLTIFKYIKYIKYYFLWGKDQYNLAYKYCQKLKSNNFSKLKVTGSPMFDYHKILKQKKNQKTLKKKIILINTGLSIANPRFSSGYENEVDNIIKEANVKKKIALSSYVSQKKIYNNLLSFLKKLSKFSKNNFKIVLNPHPFENYNVYKNYFFNNKNILILKQNNIVPVMNISDIIFSINCQTSIDSLLLNKPNFNLAFLNKKMMSSPILSKASIQINSFADCLKVIKNFDLNKKIYLKYISKNKNNLSKYFNNFNYNASIKISDIVKKTIKKKKINSSLIDYFTLIIQKYSLLVLFKIFILFILKKFNLKKNFIKMGFTDKRFEKEIFIHINKIYKKDHKINIKNIDYNLLNILRIKLNSYEIFQR